MDLYEFVEMCKEEGLSASEALDNWNDYCEERERNFLEGYYNDPEVCYGWSQQDAIDLRRYER